jgi:hypothetical protein
VKGLCQVPGEQVCSSVIFGHCGSPRVHRMAAMGHWVLATSQALLVPHSLLSVTITPNLSVQQLTWGASQFLWVRSPAAARCVLWLGVSHPQSRCQTGLCHRKACQENACGGQAQVLPSFVSWGEPSKGAAGEGEAGS